MRRWLCLAPFPFGWGDNPNREIGALAHGLRQEGEIVDFFVEDSRRSLTSDEVLCAEQGDFSDPKWWAQHGTGILITLFGTKKFIPIYRAAKSAGWKVWVRTDCDGVPGPAGGFSKYFRSTIAMQIDARRRVKGFSTRGTFLGMLSGVLRAIGGFTLSKRVNRRLLQSLASIDNIMVETELGMNSFVNYFENTGNPNLARRISIVPPAISEIYQFETTSQKGPSIVAVGQWWRFQKHMELLCKTIAASVRTYPDATWNVIGMGSELIQNRLRSISCFDAKGQVQYHGHVEPGALNKIDQHSQVIFYSSRLEGFPNTLCEALCCGSSFVGPAGIQSFDFCHSRGWGSTYKRGDLTSALAAIGRELEAWRLGERSPKQVAQEAQQCFHRHSVAKELCRIRDNMSS